MLERQDYAELLRRRLAANPVVSLLGPRQVGKTTLARHIAKEHQPAHFLDLEDPRDANWLREPMTALEPLTGLVILDEVQRQPELFPLLRVLADRRPLPARFLLLGSASPTLVRGVSESLAGRVGFVDLHGFDLGEVGTTKWRELWWRGGYPPSFLATTETQARDWLNALIRTLLEREVPQLGLTIPSATLRRFWSMVAHSHGQTWNAAEFARSLGSSEATARRYLDTLTSMFLVRQLPPWFENLGKRQVKAPKVYVRDCGMLHALLELPSATTLAGHPKLGASWEGFALEQVLVRAGERNAWYWATHGGAELDLFVQVDGRRFGFEFKHADAPSLTKSMHIAHQDLQLERLVVVTPGTRSYPLAEWAEVVGITELMPRLDQVFPRRNP
ncbi:MAG: ATP-binding protein [Verrucomicrobiales bacterium]|nr:ATP-binding protein [Verrucomicrobiales bacterium]